MGRDSRGRFTPLTADEVRRNQRLAVNASTIASRSILSHLAGYQFGGDRDIDTNLGYTKEPSLDQYLSFYNRRGLASTIVDAPAKTTWRRRPVVTDGSEGKSKFMKSWTELRDRLKVYSYLERADRLSGIGRYGVILIGTKDGQLSAPLEKVGSGKDVIYLSTFSEVYADIRSHDTNVNSPRFGRPETYSIDLKSNVVEGMKSGIGVRTVHHSRIIHVAEGLLENEVFGEPRLQKVYNYLQDLDKVVGSSAEAFWQTVVKGYALSPKEGYEFTSGALASVKEEWQSYIHNLQRLVASEGVDWKELGAKPEDPGSIFKVLIQLISGKTGIPQRILLGTERGDLASSQDEANWLGRIAERQEQFAGPNILEALIDRLIDIGALDPPQDGQYEVEWPNLFYLTDQEQAEVYEKRANAIHKVSAGQPMDLFTVPELREMVGQPAEPEGVALTVQELDESDEEVAAMFARLRGRSER